MNKKIKIQAEKCDSCFLCELTCSYQNVGECKPASSNIRVICDDKTGIAKPKLCIQCAKAVCMENCPVAAIVRAENGVVRIDSCRCVRCGTCMELCPLQAIRYDAQIDRMLKCDLCGGDPQCVKICPAEALTLVTTEEETPAGKR